MIFVICDVQLLVRKVCEPNQADHVIAHLYKEIIGLDKQNFRE